CCGRTKRLTRRGLACPCARGHGGGGPRTPREWITRARRRRASGVAAARGRSAAAVDRGRVVRRLHDEGRGAEVRISARAVERVPASSPRNAFSIGTADYRPTSPQPGGIRVTRNVCTLPTSLLEARSR